MGQNVGGPVYSNPTRRCMAVHSHGVSYETGDMRGMVNDNNPFIHHPELRDEIVDPLESNYRNLDLAFMDQKMLAAGASENWRFSDEYREASRREMLQGYREGDLWVCAYGSLMWDPAFRFSEVRTAKLIGYHRSFCIRSKLGRGTLEKPGLVAGLDKGRECSGIAFRVNRDLIDEETRVIWRREMLLHAYSPRFLQVETSLGTIESLAFIVDRTAKDYLSDLSMDETARYIATGAGIFGSSLSYLESLAGHLETMGLEDGMIFRLRDLSRQMATH